jgi:hypothetical protein
MGQGCVVSIDAIDAIDAIGTMGAMGVDEEASSGVVEASDSKGGVLDGLLNPTWKLCGGSGGLNRLEKSTTIGDDDVLGDGDVSAGAGDVKLCGSGPSSMSMIRLSRDGSNAIASE